MFGSMHWMQDLNVMNSPCAAYPLESNAVFHSTCAKPMSIGALYVPVCVVS